MAASSALVPDLLVKFAADGTPPALQLLGSLLCFLGSAVRAIGLAPAASTDHLDVPALQGKKKKKE
eukprot:6406725-Prorocentrum_lima.AAC.1